MKIFKIKHELILDEPGKERKVLYTGTKKECERKRLDYSFTYNTEWLVVEEKDGDPKEAKLSLPGLFGFMLMAGLLYINWTKNGKKIRVID